MEGQLDRAQAIHTLTEMGRALVRVYDETRAKHQSRTELPIDCIKAAARVCCLIEVVDALGLMDGQEYDRAIHEAEHGTKGIKLVPIELSHIRNAEKNQAGGASDRIEGINRHLMGVGSEILNRYRSAD
jgi:hypothetical protein